MAFRTNATGEYARRTANLPDDVLFTMCGWARIVTDRNAYSCVCSLEDATASSPRYLMIETDTDGTSLILVNETDVPRALVGVSVGEWFFFVMTSNAINSHTCEIYRSSTGVWSTATSTSSRSAMTPAVMNFGNNSYDEWFDGRVAAIKVWDAALTQAEYRAERFTYVPRRKTNLNLWCPCFSHSNLQDYGPNGRSLTAGGTLSTEEGPPIIWDYVRPRWSPYVVASGGNQTATPGAATVTLSGASPSATASGSVTATAGTATAAITGVSPAGNASGSVTLTPDIGTVTLTGASPSAAASGSVTGTAGVGTVTLTGVSPAAAGSGTGSSTAGTASVAISGVDAAIAASGSVTATPGVGTVTISGENASASGGGTQSATAGIASVSLTGETTTASASGSVTATAGTATVSLTGVSPTIAASGAATATAGVATLNISGIDATIAGSGTGTASTGVAVVTVSGSDVSSGGIVMPDVDPLGPFIYTVPTAF